jgi:hypothetical protein
MFYIFGSPRSGTTLLAQCLSTNPDIFIPDETDFIIPLALICERVRCADSGRNLIYSFIVNSERFAHSIGFYLRPKEVKKIISSVDYNASRIVDALYKGIGLTKGARVCGDKSPNDLWYGRAIFNANLVDNKTKVIHIVRDVRDVMASLNQTGWGDDFDEFFPRGWSASNLYLTHEMNKVDRKYHLIRYEDFVANPESELSKICVFLEVAYSDKMMHPEGRDPRYLGISHHSNIYKAISTASIGSFEKKMTSLQFKKYLSQAKEGLIVYGYLAADY